MEQAEIRSLLEKMDALALSDSGSCIDSRKLMVDPIVSNKLAVELLRKVDKDVKPELILSPAGIDSYFAYNVALSAWMRFGVCEDGEEGLVSTIKVKKKEKVIIVLDNYDEEKAAQFVSYVKDNGGSVVAIVSLVGPERFNSDVPCHFLITK